MNEVIGVPKERTFVEFIDQNKHYMARNGDTLHMLGAAPQNVVEE